MSYPKNSVYENPNIFNHTDMFGNGDNANRSGKAGQQLAFQ